MLKHDTVRGRRGRGRKAKAGQAKVAQLKASTPEAVTPAANAAAVADANNAAVSGAKKAVADDTNSVRRPHMGGRTLCACTPDGVLCMGSLFTLVSSAVSRARGSVVRPIATPHTDTAHQHPTPTAGAGDGGPTTD